MPPGKVVTRRPSRLRAQKRKAQAKNFTERVYKKQLQKRVGTYPRVLGTPEGGTLAPTGLPGGKKGPPPQGGKLRHGALPEKPRKSPRGPFGPGYGKVKKPRRPRRRAPGGPSAPVRPY